VYAAICGVNKNYAKLAGKNIKCLALNNMKVHLESLALPDFKDLAAVIMSLVVGEPDFLAPILQDYFQRLPRQSLE
jgi:hypothetical protein|tara:strand:- start:1752 stop:1979 length:228 start_codon:yes stop_codon:yes gene_type:complete